MAPDSLSSVLITAELSRRRPTAIDREVVNAALRHLHEFILVNDAQGLTRTLTEVAQTVCEAGTGGLSVLETSPEGSEIFRWEAMSGALAAAVGGTTPRDWSPCGVTLERNAAQLFLHPERFFTYFAAANPLIVEGLVLPLRFPHGEAFGTLWIASHDEQRHFTSAEAEVMHSLCSFTMAAAQTLAWGPRTRGAVPEARAS